jgi:low molecular weight protein-tyrosine phosphatase
MPHTPYRVVFVCSGNICRSPMAEVIARELLSQAGLDGQVEVDSAGTGGWHVGQGADPRSVQALADHGYDGTRHRAREFAPEWFAARDLVLVADRGHERQLRAWAPDDAARDKIRLLRTFDPRAVAAGRLEVDDPWYGGADDFERCVVEVEEASVGLVDWLTETLADRTRAQVSK